MEKRHIIFDFANVLVVYDPKEYIKRLFESEGERLAAYNALFNSLQWLKLDRGVISEQEALQAILGNTPDPLKEKVEYLFYNWHKNIKPIPEMELLVKQLKERGYKLYLLSNIAKSYELYRGSIPALKYMDYEFLSYKVNLLKPDSRIYMEFLKEYRLSPSECYYIDDFTYNVEIAQSLGIASYLFDGDVEKLKRDMAEHSIL